MQRVSVGVRYLSITLLWTTLLGTQGLPTENLKGVPNIVLLLADDLNYDTPGFMGGKTPEITPHLDKLAASGFVFRNCHNACSICGPSRAAMMTGLYPQRNGDMGHVQPVPAWWENANRGRTITSLASYLQDHGYFTVRIDKSGSRFDRWNESLHSIYTGVGRDPNLYYLHTKNMIAKAKEQKRPFFMNINSRDPHEYWAGSPQETTSWAFKDLGAEPPKSKRKKKKASIPAEDENKYRIYPSGKPYPDPSRSYSASEVVLPFGLPDTSAIREQFKHYCNSVRRLDDTVGKILQALEESGETENTIVMFWSDNGLGWPFCKFTDYPNGTRTPLIIKWPGHVQPGTVDRKHVVATVDIMPTLLDVVGLDQPNPLDGISLLGLLEGRVDDLPRSEVFDCFNFMGNPDDRSILLEQTYDPNLAKRTEQYRPMRGLHNAQFTYVWNAWSDGERKLPLQMAASSIVIKVLQSIDSNPNDENYGLHRGRADFYLKRVPEELYDTVRDPGCQQNLINDPAFVQVVDSMRKEMKRVLENTSDHEEENYQKFLDLLHSAKAKP